jgi:hypothetical protein
MVSPLQKAEEAVKKVEDFYSRDDPMTEIDKVRGVEHAYYDEKAMKEAEEALAEAEKGEEYSCIECTNHYDGKGHYDDVGEGPFCDRCFELLTGTTGPKGEEEVTPLDAGAVKHALDKAFVDASDLVKGIEEFVKDVETLDMDKIDAAIELLNNISQTLKDAKAMGYPVGDLAEPEPSSDILSEPRAKEPEKGEA